MLLQLRIVLTRFPSIPDQIHVNL